MSSGEPACSTAARWAGLRSSSSLSGSTASRTRRGRRGSGAEPGESADSVGISIWLLLISEQAYDRHRHFLPTASGASVPLVKFRLVQTTTRFFYGYRSPV